jgi:selenocysteine lyase/cysteine desulfurase
VGGSLDVAALRAELPVLARVTYLNAGTCGPLPARMAAAAGAELEREVREGRFVTHFERMLALRERQRGAYAGLLGCDPGEVSLTTSTSDGIATALAGLDLRAGEEILTAEDEHPGLLGPLQAARDLRGATVRTAPLAELAAAVGPDTALVACSHVSWVTGELAPASELARTGVPVLLDGAQGIGAIPVDVRALGCAIYAGSGQKWLCGPDGTGMLYIAAGFRERVARTRRSYISYADVSQGLEASLHPDARAYDAPALSREASAAALASLAVLAEHGWDAVHARARELAGALTRRLGELGRTVAPRGETTLVSWESPDPEAERDGLAEAGIVVRNLPGTPYVRASVGAWNDEGDLERLVAALASRATR